MTHHTMPASVPAFAVSLQGVQLIEASAGTGKTWTLSALVVRLVLERSLTIQQVLAITFTKAAAAELRDRIRQRLSDVWQHVTQKVVSTDPLCLHAEEWLASQPEKQIISGIQRLYQALGDFDQATITTIHGFCQGVLSEQALASGMPLELEVVSDLLPLLHEIIADYCRQQWKDADPVLVNYFLTREEFGISELQAFVASVLNQSHARVQAHEGELPSQQTLANAQTLFAQLQQVWPQQHSVVRNLVLSHKGLLNGVSYRIDYIEQSLQVIQELMTSPIEALWQEASIKAFTRFSRQNLDEKRNKEAKQSHQFVPQHPFFELAGQLLQVATSCQQYVELQALDFKARLLAHCRQQIQERLLARQAQNFDMQVRGLADALMGSQGLALANALRQRYPAALVDEFQDTDDHQYRILQKLYMQSSARDCVLFLVGDPKQAIYRFRGADVYTYLKAYQAVPPSNRHQLASNQRSVTPLIEALNRFFTLRQDAFNQPEIAYHPVSAGQRQHAPLLDEREQKPANWQPLRFIVSQGEIKTDKETGRQWAIKAVVHEVVRLLQGAAEGKVRLGERPLAGQDIAILVRAHYEAEELRYALAAAGVKAAMQSRDKVFASREAEDMSRIVAAFADPHDEGKVRAALASRLCGQTVADFLAWQENPQQWADCLLRFQDYQQRWQQRGFMAAWRAFIQQEGVIARVAALPSGERLLTNLLHLADLLHEESRQRAGMSHLVEWLARQRSYPQESANAELRLESDENLIRIMTIHQSKGLEFPIVFVPMLWSPPNYERGTPFYHQGEHSIFDLRKNLSEDIKQQVQRETLSEDLRVGYVALTRAAQRCYVLWFPINTKTNRVEESMLGFWLPDGVQSLQQLHQQQPQLLAVLPFDGTPKSEPRLKAITEKALPLQTAMPPSLPWPFRLTSFSTLNNTKNAHSDAAEQPDHDQFALTYAPDEDELPDERFHFPGQLVAARNAGNCLHRIFEKMDFSQPVAEAQTEITKALQFYGIHPDWQECVQTWLSEVVATPLLPHFTLKQLPYAHSLRELAFHLPLRQFSTQALVDCLARHGLPVADLPAQRITGFLKGSIDLVFIHQGKYYIADYKSNDLGKHWQFYHMEPLQLAMKQHGYYLQAAIYTLALHRWLSSRLADYHPERHLGGVFYLFLRGMHPQHSQAGQGHGVLAWRPSLDLLMELEHILTPELA